MGLLHPLSLLILWWRLKGRFEQVDLTRGPDMAGLDRSLVVAGMVISGIGGILLALIAANWELCVQAATPAGAAQAATAAGGVSVVGLALLYAGMPKKSPA
jgi:ACS family hexuronate transporter-like MFS transporter